MGPHGVSAICPACDAPVSEAHRFCPTCGAGLDVSENPTGTDPRRASPISPASPAYVHSPGSPPSPRPPGSRSARATGGSERFAPGTILLDRYRIVGLLGRGGMGEVYRADDLKLDHPVALKFLPAALQDDPERLERLYGEVRMARQVSHPAVCRVWDVGEAGGQHFLSMEFIDGENLASLLRRIGRLPADKALAIARQVAAGLAAAHEKGVLHRDLKPANVMLDGQGNARITDFGLASLAESRASDDPRSGTPSYMSPEQLQGREVTVRSDIYALGLLLYELHTGRRAFEGRSFAELLRKHREERPIEPSAIVPDLPPAVERTILACLEKAPGKRPPSANAVLSMLAGQDPLAAAIAAGETPSPELVAAAGDQASLRPAVAWACLAVAILGALLVPFTRTNGLLGRVPVEKSPAVLQDRARDLIARLGYGGAAVDGAEGFQVDEDYLRQVARTDASVGRWDGLATGDPPVIQYWYRESPRPLAANSPSGRVTFSDPPLTVSGMTGVRYDLRGRLMSFYTIPPQREEAPAPAAATAPGPPDWSPLFSEAKLDAAALIPTEPQWTPPFFCDTRAAWEARWPARPDLPLRVEAAAHRGRLVFFRIVNPWTRAERDQPYVPTPGQRVSLALILVILGVLLVGGGVLAKRNLQLGRGDRRGAFRIGFLVFALGILAWLIVAHHVADPVAQLLSAVRGAGTVLLAASTMWLFHLAIEPYVRRERPWTIVSWTRLLDGGVGDTVVGRDVLFGTVWGVVIAVVGGLAPRLPRLLGQPEPPPQAGFLDILMDLRSRLAFVVARPLDAALVGLAMLLLFLVLRFLLRRDKPASLALVLVLCVVHVAQSAHPLWYSIPFGLFFVGALVWLLLRYGLVATIAGLCVSDLLAATPQSLEIDEWVGAGTVFAVPLVAVLAVYAFRVASRPTAATPRVSHPDGSGARSG